MSRSATPRYLLLQMRKPEDPMRGHEIACFVRELDVTHDDVDCIDLATEPPNEATLDRYDAILLGGSGHYSVVHGGPWFDDAMDALRRIADRGRPTFASCWGFQALAHALGGRVENDWDSAELGTKQAWLTEAGRTDPIFGHLHSPFHVQLGHEDTVVALPEEALLLASTERTTNQAYRLTERLIYATQFHPELEAEDLRLRLETYPRYVEKISGRPAETFFREEVKPGNTSGILPRFAKAVAQR